MEENRLYLKTPTIKDEAKVEDFRNEFLQMNQKITRIGGINKIKDFSEWLINVQNNANFELLNDGKDVSLIYMSYSKEDNRLIGILQIKLCLDFGFLSVVASVGGSVRPSEQNKGYGKEQLDLACGICRKIGVERFKILLDENNEEATKTFL